MEICDNGADDDGDELVDAADPDCGWPEVCDDGVDNDGDGWIDGCDADCAVPETACGDDFDNDCDGVRDCSDADCFGATGACDVESSCTDGLDNDGDSAVDCADGDCTAPPCETVELSCTDAFDNDGDGDVDCADSDCSSLVVCTDYCGDNLVTTVLGEVCDDGVTPPADFDGCSADCTWVELLYDRFDGTPVPGAAWASLTGTVVAYTDAASPPQSMRISQDGSSVTSTTVDTSGCSELAWEYEGQQGSTFDVPDPTDFLYREYDDGSGTWVQLDAWEGQGQLVPFEQRSGSITDTAAFQAAFAVRFRLVASSFDDYSIDDFRILCRP